ncbi:MAG: PD40 domain-containing protein [Chloroflexi bacterium]|nr:PD40 domain-containing protein [Chloroflexota bacterium]
MTAGVGHNVLLADLAGGKVEPLTTSGDNVNAVWMPDGRGVLLLSWSRSGTTWTLLDLASGRRGAFLFHRQVLDSRPTWSSDGQTLAFASYAEQRFSIWTLDLADGQPRLAIVSRQELGAPRFVGWGTPRSIKADPTETYGPSATYPLT